MWQALPCHAVIKEAIDVSYLHVKCSITANFNRPVYIPVKCQRLSLFMNINVLLSKSKQHCITICNIYNDRYL